MSNEYFSAHSSQAEADAAAKSNAVKKARKWAVVGAIAAVVVLPTAAFAYYSDIFGTGSISGDEATAATLTVNQDGVEKAKLHPDTPVDVKFRVYNPNPFPVSVTKVQATDFSSSNCTTPTQQAWFSGFATQLNQDVSLATAVTVPKNGNAVVTIPQGLKLSADATKSCQYTIALKVTAAQISAS